MGRIAKDLEGTRCGVIEEKCRRLAGDKKGSQDSRLLNHDTKREPPEFMLEVLVLDPHSSVSLLFGGGDGDDDDEVNSSVSCWQYRNLIYYHVSLPAQLSFPFSTIV
jgi:hypothetical protein